MDKIGDNLLTRILWIAGYISFYVAFAPAWYWYLLLPIHALMGPVQGAIVNWVGHKYGYSNFDNGDHSRNSERWGIFLLGELFQNNHHHAGARANFAAKWWEIDPVYPIIKLFNKLGVIKLIPEEFGNTRQKITYPRMTTTGIEAIISRREQLYTFNGFWNVAAQGNGQPLWSTQWSDLVTQYPIDKIPNTKSVRPVSVSYQKAKIKSDFAKVRLIQDQYSRFKFINTIQITQTNP
jgi:hypothetical protein